VRAATAGLPVGLVAALLLLAGCGEPTAEEVRADYCATVKEQQRTLSEKLADRSPTALLDAQPQFRRLAAEAPGDIADEWRVVLDAVEGLDEALADAGVDPATYDPDKPPRGLTPRERGAIERAAAELLNPETREAAAFSRAAARCSGVRGGRATSQLFLRDGRRSGGSI